MSNRVVRFHEFGGPEALRLEDMPLAQPQPGEVRIRVGAMALNRADALFRANAYVETPVLPSRLGYDVAGTIEAVGEGVTRWTIGDRVATVPAFSVREHGMHGETALAPADSLIRIPAGMSFEQAAGAGVAYLTGYFGLVDLGRLREGQTVVVTAGTSSTGLAAIQIARMLGARVIATTRTDAKAPFLTEVGADHVVVTEREDVRASILEATGGRGAEVVYDAVAGPLLESLAWGTAIRGRLIVYGAMSMASGEPLVTPLPLWAAFTRSLLLHAGYKVFDFSGNANLGLVRDEEAFARGKLFLELGLASGALKPHVDRVLPLEAYAEAHRILESNAQTGKIVVAVNG